MAVRVIEADGGAADEHARRGALDAKVGRQDLSKLPAAERASRLKGHIEIH
jgi:hypothetical protein